MHNKIEIKISCNRSQVQGSTFRVKNKESIQDSPEALVKMPIYPNNCQFGSEFWIGPDEPDAFFFRKYASQMQFRDKNGTLNP